MRYFRFYSRLSRNGTDHDLGTLKAIEENGDGLAGVSGERIWSEMAKIIDQKFNFEFFDLVYRLKIDKPMGLPACDFNQRAARYKAVAVHENAESLTKLAVLVDSPSEVTLIDNRLKLSKKEFEFLHFLVGQQMLADAKNHQIDSKLFGSNFS